MRCCLSTTTEIIIPQGERRMIVFREGNHALVPENPNRQSSGWCNRSNPVRENKKAITTFQNILDINFSHEVKTLALRIHDDIDLDVKFRNGTPLLEREVNAINQTAGQIKTNLPHLKAMVKHVYLFNEMKQMKQENDRLDDMMLDKSDQRHKGNFDEIQLSEAESSKQEESIPPKVEQAASDLQIVEKKGLFRKSVYRLKRLVGISETVQPSTQPSKKEKNIKISEGVKEAFDPNRVIAYLHSLPLTRPLDENACQRIQQAMIEFVQEHKQINIPVAEIKIEIVKQLCEEDCQIQELFFLKWISDQQNIIPTLMTRRDVTELNKEECLSLIKISTLYQQSRSTS